MKKRRLLLLSIFLWIGLSAFGANYYVSPSGNDSNSGSLSSPLKTLEKAVTLVAPGDYIYLRGGTYNMTVSSLVITRDMSGTSGAMIRVFAYNSETPVLSFNNVANSSSRGIVQDGAYWHWKGITIEKAGDNGMLLSGNNNTIENCVFRSNNDTGLQLSRYSTSYTTISQWPSNNLIVGCESYNNKDAANEDADGFAAKLTCGNGNIFRDCVSHHNIDDGWDLYTKSDTGPIGEITFENCIAHSNGTLTDGVTSGGGDKNGFKLGSSSNSVNHVLRRCIAFNNGKHGFTDNGNIGSIKFINLTSYNNGDYNYHTRDGASHKFVNCISFSGAHADRIVGDASGSNAFTDTDTQWPYTASSADFQTMTIGANNAPTANGFLNLKSGSPLIDAGNTYSGIEYSSSAPDLGAIEYGGITNPTTYYTLTTNVNGSGSVSPSGGSYASGSSVSLTATPASGYVFSNWSGDVSGSSNPATVTMNSNKAVTAVFTQSGNTTPPVTEGDQIHNFTQSGTNSSFYTISGNLSTSKGTVSYNGLTLTQCLKIESSTSISFTSTQEGALTLVFNNDFNGGIKIDGTSYAASAGILTINIAAGSHTITKDATANLYYISLAYAGGTTTTYSLTTTVIGQGTVTPSNGTYEEGTVVSMTATPASGWQFAFWSGGYTGTTASVTMDANKSITATFTQITNTTSIQIQENTTGFCGVDGTVDSNNAGYTGAGFANTTNASGTGIDYKVNSTGGSVSLTIQYANGSTDRPANIIVNGNTVVSSLSMPSTGSWTNWSSVTTSFNLISGSNTIRIETTGSAGLANIDYIQVTGAGISAADCNGTVTTYTLSTNITGSGTVSPSGGTYNSGTVISLTATPASGYTFTGWSGSASGTSNPLSVTMDSNKSITATFTQNCTPTVIVPYVQVNGGSWAQSASASVVAGDAVSFGPQPSTGGSWIWSGPNGYSSTSRQISFTNLQASQSGTYTATYTNTCGAISTQAFSLTVTTATTTIQIQENTTGFCGVDGTVDSNNAGYTGAGFANTSNASGTGIDWNVNFATAGTYTFVFRYAGTSDRPANLIIGGTTAVSGVAFVSTGSWTAWTTVSTSATVSAGTKTVRLQATGTSGLSNIDYIEITGSNPQAVSCSSSPDTYTLTTSVNGSGSVSPSNGTYDAGSTVTITATPANGYLFTGWSGSASGTSNPLTLTINSDISVTAIFTQSTTPVPDNSMIGYATVNADGYSTTTGGQGGNATTVNSLSALQAWASNRENNTTPEILYISGKISASSTTVVDVKHGANVSILGIGSAAELQNIGLNIWDYENVIVRNLKIHEVFYPDDALTIDACNHVWIDHCELHSKIGSGIGVDTYDGLLDIKRGSKWVTVSWCYLHDHMKCSLIGHTDNTSAQAADSQMRITYHHNYFYNTDGRNPSLRYGALHMFNNYFNTISDYGLAARDGAHAKVENNHYNDVKLSMSTDKFPVSGLPNGYICASGNMFTGTTGAPVISQTGCDWWTSSTLPYSYTLDAASTISTTVPANVGVGKIAELKVAFLSENLNANSETVKAELRQNYPNPFTNETTIEFTLSEEENANLAIFNISGQKIAQLVDGVVESGVHQLRISEAGIELPKGTYVYRLIVNDLIISKVMIKK
ncbi:MAG: carbohydrate-binding protein [Marinilabiliaceae bacterium]|nr:carbohydrate-binding protein [Marinilabiliaceae bacterium]